MPEGQFPDPPTDEEIESRLADNKKRLDAARRKYEKEAVPQGPIDAEGAKGMGIGLSAAYAIIGLPLVGAGLGWLLDRWLNTSVFIPILAVLGLVGGMVNAVQLSNRK
jgi:ATP synthase protein I